MLSILDTLKETLVLCVQNFWRLIVLTIVTEPLDIFLRQLHFDYSGSLPIELISSTAIMGLDIVNLAALLGLLSEPLSSAVIAAFRGIKAYTISLIWLTLLISVVCIAYCICIAIAVHFQALFKIKPLLEGGLYLLFMSCALSVPLLALQKPKAIGAFKWALSMTRRHFLYVMGCFLMTGGTVWLISWALGISLSTPDGPMTWSGLPLKFLLDLGGSAAIILLWAMCRQMIAEENRPVP